MAVIYLVSHILERDHNENYNKWMEEEHSPALLAVPGYRAAIRNVDVNNPCRYLNIWEIDSMDAFNSPERAKGINTPWNEELRPHRQNLMLFIDQTDPIPLIDRAYPYAAVAAVLHRNEPLPVSWKVKCKQTCTMLKEEGAIDLFFSDEVPAEGLAPRAGGYLVWEGVYRPISVGRA